MTREEVAVWTDLAAETLDNALTVARINGDPTPAAIQMRVNEIEACEAAAVELRKTCSTCQHWSKPDDDWDEENYPRMLYACAKSTIFTPGNGAGYCHEWKAKP